jgi:RNA polymerase sigma-70 factor, ECF subfamily
MGTRADADPEREAAEALAAGDRDRALTILMGAYGRELYRHCRQVLGDDDLAEEVHQTVFVQAHRDLPRWGGRSSMRTWLHAIARHRCLDAIKIARRRRRRLWLLPALPERADPAPGADERLDARSREVRLEAALARLEPKVRIAVLLRHREGMSYEEMAQVCGEKPGTLQARVARALPALRRWLEEGEKEGTP